MSTTDKSANAAQTTPICSNCSTPTPCTPCQDYAICQTVMCVLCMGSGMMEEHLKRCWAGMNRYDNRKTPNFVCTCTNAKSDCDDCWRQKVAKYNCYVCKRKPAALRCMMCQNFFVCSKDCSQKPKMKQHYDTCAKPSPVLCGHGMPLLTMPVCQCKMCMHGLWDKDCFICTTSQMNAAGRPILLGSGAAGGAAGGAALGSGAAGIAALGSGAAGGAALGSGAALGGGPRSGIARGAASQGAAASGSGGVASGGSSFQSDPSQTAFSRPKRKRE